MADWTPQSRAEEILFKTINGEPYDGLPQSRIEELLLELKEVIEQGGGGGGTYTTTVLFTNGAIGDTTFQLSSAYTNFDAIAIYYSHFDGQDQYEDVRIYPTTFLNSVSSTDEVLGFTNDVWYYYFSVYSTTEFRYVKSNAGYITDIIGIKYGSNSGGGGGGTDNYNLLKNLPQINGKIVKGNMSGTSLGLVNMVMGKDLSTNDYTNTDKAIVDSVTTDLADKVDKITGKGLSTNDYTDADKAIVGGVTSALSNKVDKVTGKGLSTNDYDDTAKGIVDGVTSALAGKVDTSLVGSANGVAELDANGRVPSSQLPSYVDDVLDYADLAHFPATGETGKIYIADDTNKEYRWSGSGYAVISESLALGETSSTAYAGNKGKANADAIAGIKNGTSINSFGAVETALAGKANSSDLGDKSNLTTTDKSSVVEAINELNSNYEGVDLTVKFANEIANHSNEWAWIQSRLDNHNVRDLHVGDYIPINIAANGGIAAETHKAEIAGINTYRRTGDSGHEVGYHIDWITRDCYSGTVKFNTTNINNGNASNSSPFLASNLKSWLDGTLYPLLDAKLKAVIKAKRILAPYRYQSGATLTDDNSWGWQDFDKLWVPLEGEIFDSLVWSTKGYGNGQAVQYPIFANSYTHRMKGAGPGGSRADWWTASALSGNSTSVVLVYTAGTSSYSSASSAVCVPVCFRTMEA